MILQTVPVIPVLVNGPILTVTVLDLVQIVILLALLIHIVVTIRQQRC